MIDHIDRICKKLGIQRQKTADIEVDWCIQKAREEDNCEIGAGMPINRLSVLPNYEKFCRLIAFVHETEYLSEGQLADLLMADRVEIRAMCDNGRTNLQKWPIKGAWAQSFMAKINDA